MRKTNDIIYAMFIGILFVLIGCTSNDKKLNNQLSTMASNLNESTPAVLDPHTRFDSVAVTPENIFQYYYTIVDISNPHELLSNQKEEIINNMGKAFMTDKSLRIFVDNDVTIQYIYRDSMQNVIDIITIDPDTYKQPH